MASYEYKNGDLNRIAGGTLYADSPIGSIIPYGGTVAPRGWFICDGSALNRLTYAELFAVIGTSYGAGDGSTTFNLPDLRETVPVGVGTRESGITDHDTYNLGQFKDDQLEIHQHYISVQSGGINVVTRGSSGDSIGWNVPMTVSNDGNPIYASPASMFYGRTGTTTHGKQLGVNFIIKAQQIGVPADFASAIENVIDDSIINMTGTFTVELSANGFDNVGVNFPNSLPNINYCLSFQPIATGSILFSVMNRYSSSAVVNVRNLNDSALTVNCNWFLICKR